jgi:hypothetical protein
MVRASQVKKWLEKSKNILFLLKPSKPAVRFPRDNIVGRGGSLHMIEHHQGRLRV